MTEITDKEVACLGGGCFWCLEPIFEELRGVEEVVPGYSGGDDPEPTYRQVCAGTTGHAEVVQIIFDPKQISYEDILRVFFTIHDPTTPNRQGADVGTQYRSVIYFRSREQQHTAEKVIEEVNRSGIWSRPIVTELAPLEEFYLAEDYHHDYFANNPEEGYCRVIIEPKVAKFREKYRDRLKV